MSRVLANDNVFLSSQTVEWPTPQGVYDKLNDEFGFTVDVAATPTNTKCERFYTVDDDGLSQSWDGETVWCNPPYGPQLTHWVYKAATAEATTVMLVPARTDVKWFHNYVLGKAEIRFIKGRLTFGDATAPAPFPCMLLIFRNEETDLDRCPDCNGSGLVSSMAYDGRETTYTCPTCNGHGVIA